MPSTISWQGGAPANAQINTWTFAGVWIVGDSITVTVGFKSASYLITSATISTFLPLLAAFLEALSGANYPEHGEIAWDDPTAATLTGTATTAGKPFGATISTNSVAGTINGGASSTGTATAVSSGPNDWTTAANWVGLTVPVTGDSTVLNREGTRIYWGLNQSAVTLAGMYVLAQDVVVGLPKSNNDSVAYPEYRDDHLRIGATVCLNQSNSGRLKIDFGSVQVAYTQLSSGRGIERNVPAVLLKGTHASNSFAVNGGNAGLGFFGEATTALTLSVQTGATVTCGAGCTLGTVTNDGGELTVNSAIATALNHPSTASGTTTIYGTGAVAQITAQGGQIWYNTTGTLGGNTVLGNAALLSVDGDQQTKHITNPISLYSSDALFSDRFKVVAGGYVVKYVNCEPQTIGFGSNVQVTVATL